MASRLDILRPKVDHPAPGTRRIEDDTPTMLMLRLARAGSKKRPVYHLVAADRRSRRDGRFIENLGYYIPTREILVLQQDRIEHWLSVGAQMTDTARAIVKKARRLGNTPPPDPKAKAEVKPAAPKAAEPKAPEVKAPEATPAKAPEATPAKASEATPAETPPPAAAASAPEAPPTETPASE